ncbi:hypothetical protein [Achromobacter insolitus]|uniref:hypothetical protein n=1 Tax=Achromobacter insolitus TaxID=217204 RepID=UPI00241F986A|nr:hypothetical protein [Achromobacter insolitus]
MRLSATGRHRPVNKDGSRPIAGAIRPKATVDTSLNINPKQPDFVSSSIDFSQLLRSLAVSSAGETLFDELELLAELYDALFQCNQRCLMLVLHVCWSLGERNRLSRASLNFSLSSAKCRSPDSFFLAGKG